MGLLLALAVWGVTVASVILFAQGTGYVPEAISEAAGKIDAQFMLTLVLTGLVFVLAQGLLGYFIFKYRADRSGPARHVHGNNLIEAGGAIVTGVVFLSLAVMGQQVWAALHLQGSDAAATHIEVTGEQFAWNVRYSGLDGKFGRTDPRLFDPTGNPVGIDPDDPAGDDDVVMLNRLIVPVDTPIELRLRSKDVLHSLFLPQLRIKQDTVPGLEIPLRFQATSTGNYELACAELCGLGHYRMKGFLEILAPEDYQSWLVEQVRELQAEE